MNPACLSDVCEDENYFLKLTRAQLKSNVVVLDLSGSTQYRAQQYEISLEVASTLKNNSHPHRRLTDMLDTFLESSDNAQQNQQGWFFNFFF